jgi:hypothetical protein
MILILKNHQKVGLIQPIFLKEMRMQLTSIFHSHWDLVKRIKEYLIHKKGKEKRKKNKH